MRIGCACLIGLVFAVSAVSKLRDFDGFAKSVPALVPACAGARSASRWPVPSSATAGT
ncbi:hypothetical protein ACLQ2P_26280 [Actinomadura citrea]|uniref:hypothetical protein n=1 Tax=Actinomadura citrea TaxID=46158 RepID=UPI003CE5394C